MKSKIINALRTSDVGLALIKNFEGFRNKPYLCSAGVVTIGYGTTRIDGKPVTWSTPAVTPEQASIYLQEDVKRFEKVINEQVTVKLLQHEFDALVCFVYNVGPGNFNKSTLLRLLNQNKKHLVPAQFLRWNKANGREVRGLTIRRQKEAMLFEGF